jgi:hypothetical protein
MQGVSPGYGVSLRLSDAQARVTMWYAPCKEADGQMRGCRVVALDNGLISLLSTACTARMGVGQHPAGAMLPSIELSVFATARGP